MVARSWLWLRVRSLGKASSSSRMAQKFLRRRSMWSKKQSKQPVKEILGSLTSTWIRDQCCRHFMDSRLGTRQLKFICITRGTTYNERADVSLKTAINRQIVGVVVKIMCCKVKKHLFGRALSIWQGRGGPTLMRIG